MKTNPLLPKPWRVSVCWADVRALKHCCCAAYSIVMVYLCNEGSEKTWILCLGAVARWSVNKLPFVTDRRILRMSIAWEICQWTVWTLKRRASILLDMNMSRNVTIMQLLTRRTPRPLNASLFVKSTDLWRFFFFFIFSHFCHILSSWTERTDWYSQMSIFNQCLVPSPVSRKSRRSDSSVSAFYSLKLSGKLNSVVCYNTVTYC